MRNLINRLMLAGIVIGCSLGTARAMSPVIGPIELAVFGSNGTHSVADFTVASDGATIDGTWVQVLSNGKTYVDTITGTVTYDDPAQGMLTFAFNITGPGRKSIGQNVNFIAALYGGGNNFDLIGSSNKNLGIAGSAHMQPVPSVAPTIPADPENN